MQWRYILQGSIRETAHRQFDHVCGPQVEAGHKKQKTKLKLHVEYRHDKSAWTACHGSQLKFVKLATVSILFIDPERGRYAGSSI